jgi:hypothetical protein
MSKISRYFLIFCSATLLFVAGCGSSHGASKSSTPGTTSAGDIPDTANYLTYRGSSYSLKYVEGWGIQKNTGGGVTISDKDSSETVTVPSSQISSVSHFAATDLAQLARTAPRFHIITKTTAGSVPGMATHVQYQTLSPQDPVTGKRVPVIVDRYYIPGPRKLAVLTLATPRGVDNVDAFRLIARSFRWK